MSTSTSSRNLWPASIIGFFISAFIFMATFVLWAMHRREDLVSADYYEREVRYQQQLDSMNRSQALATQVVVTFDPAQQAIIITLPAIAPATPMRTSAARSSARRSRSARAPRKGCGT